MRKPIAMAIREIDMAIADLEGKPRPDVPAPVDAAAAGSAAPGAGSAQGSAATPDAAGTGSDAKPPVAPVAAPANPAERAKQLAVALRGARNRLMRIAEDRASAEVLLTQLELRARDKTQLRQDLGHDVAEQRSGLGTLYAELAADVAKSGDKARAKRLLTIAAHLDPGNRVRYEQQLHTFDKSASLPPDTGAATGSGGVK
jgi:hypothetical protein